MKLLIMSDVHGNLNALNAMLKEIKKYEVNACILLGDLIDYGMRSNEVIQSIQSLKIPILCNISGNHENAVLFDNYAKFSSQRGVESAKNTKKNLNAKSWDYIKNAMDASGKKAFEIEGKSCLAIHGSLKDEYWKSITLTDDFSSYFEYDYVFSGHSHLPHFIEYFHEVENPSTRNKKKTLFINPGSVGQPRNLNCCAQAAIFDTHTQQINFLKVAYDVADEQKYFTDSVDAFYKERLEKGV